MTFTAPTWNLESILDELRLISGRPDVTMMTDQEGVNFINYYYQYVLPKELKIFWGYTYYKFYTQANVDQYLAPAGFQTFNPAVYFDGWPGEWYLNPDEFYQDYPQQENKTVVATGTGSFNNFVFQIPAFPIIIGSLYVTDGTQIAQDNGSGGFVNPNNNNSPLAGVINYANGTVSGLAFPVPPAANTNIVQASQTYIANRPQGILYFKSAPLADSTPATLASIDMFVLRPVPDQVYLVKMQGIQVPPPLIELTDVPFRPDLGPLIALGAALQVFKRFNQMDQIEQYTPEYNRYKDISMQDTYEEYLYERATSRF